MKPTIVSLFSGIGGLDLAAHWAGFETVRFVEKEPFCQKVLAKHWSNVPIDDDVFTSHPLHADMVVGGFPCQPFSVAGNQRGAADERYLLPEMLRVVREVQPYAVLFENVPGFPSLNHGYEFKYLLRTLAEMGFDAQWGHLRASDVGAPHKRERWFCVAYRENTRINWRFGQQANDESGSRKRLGAFDCRSNGGVEVMADSIGNGNGECGQWRAHDNEKRNGAAQECRRDDQQSRIVAHGQNVGDSNGECFQESGKPIRPIGNQANGNRENYRPRYASRGQAQPGFCGTAHGLPNRLDFVGFPARPGQPQFAYEPPHTRTGTKDTNARIKALGNAVVPQVAYPIFAALMDWFVEMEAERKIA